MYPFTGGGTWELKIVSVLIEAAPVTLEGTGFGSLATLPETWNFSPRVGLIGLFGIAVQNGLVLLVMFERWLPHSGTLTVGLESDVAVGDEGARPWPRVAHIPARVARHYAGAIDAGAMFGFRRKKLSGSYCALIRRSLAMLLPYANVARAPAVSSACPVKLV